MFSGRTTDIRYAGGRPRGAMTIDPESLRELAAEIGFWPATTERLTSSGTVGRLRFTLCIFIAEEPSIRSNSTASSRHLEGNTTVVLLANFRFHRLPLRLSPLQRVRVWPSPGGWSESPTEWSGQGDSCTVEVGVGDDRCQRGSRDGSAWCDLRRRQFRRVRTSPRSGRAAGHRANGHDNDTSARAGD